RFELRKLAVSQVETLAARSPGTVRWAVSPQILSPLVWEGIIQSNKQVLKVSIDPLGETPAEITRMKSVTMAEIPKQAFESEPAMALMPFARFPVFRLQGTAEG